jgi:hypothetical protein
MACGKLTLDQLNDCDFPIQSGTADSCKILSISDIATSAFNATTKAYDSFTNTVPGSAVTVEGINNSIKPKYSRVSVGVHSRYDHDVSMTGFDISPAAKHDLENGIDGRYVIVIENTFKGLDGQSAFEIYGFSTGLKLVDLMRDVTDTETQGAFSFRFFTEINKEPKMPASLWSIDYATTKAIYDAL